MALLEEEFQRLQTQFLEMKTSNYNLEDSIRRKDNEMVQLRSKNEELEKELNKLQKVLKFNPFAKKEMKEKDSIDSLQRKMDSQEEEFKRTNETLRMEISSLIKTNQRLKDRLIEVGIEDFDDDEDVNCYESTTRSNIDDANESRDGDLGTSSVVDGQWSPTKNGHGINSSPMRFAILKEKELLENKVLDLDAKFKSEVKANEVLNHKLEETNMILDTIKQQLAESEQLANQRKDLIDEMKEHIENQTLKNDEKVNQLQSTINSLNLQLTSLSNDKDSLTMTVEDLNHQISEKIEQIRSLSEEKETLTTSLQEMKNQIEALNASFDQKIAEIESDKERTLLLITETSASEVADLKDKMRIKDEEIRILKKEFEGSIKKIDENIEERKIHEKKGLMIVKDLKKQINAEKARADKLQEKLNQYLNENCPNVHDQLDMGHENGGQRSTTGAAASSSFSDAGIGGNHANHGQNQGNKNDDTSSSIGSWSFMPNIVSKRGHRRNSSAQSGQSGVERSSPTTSASPSNHVTSNTDIDAISMATCSNVSIIESENLQLVSRIKSMQEEKWVLEEKLNQLMASMDKLSKETESKSQIIKFYCMDGRCDAAGGHSKASASAKIKNSDKMTVGRVMNFIKKGDESNMKEINGKLQRMLEETLIKNMHLHQDIERLSQQLMSESASSSSASTITSPPTPANKS